MNRSEFVLKSMEIWAWPVAALVFGLAVLGFFQKQLAGFIERVKTVSGKGFQAETGEEQKSSAVAKRAEELKRAFDSPLLLEQEQRIRNDLGEVLKAPEAVDVLIRHLAATQIIYRFENLYWLIWGSQIAILQHLNANASGTELRALRPFYDLAAKQYPDAFASYSFEAYLGFLETAGLVQKQGNQLVIAPIGREFLGYLHRAGKNTVKLY